MEKNTCGADRLARLVFGTLLVLVALGIPGIDPGRDRSIANWRIVAMYAGAELLVTGLTQWCPMNALLGINTCTQDTRTALRSAIRRGR